MSKKVEEIIETAIKEAFQAGRLAAERSSKDCFKAAERRLYALPIIREKLQDDKERLEEIRTYGPHKKSSSITRFQKNGVRLSPEEILETVILDMEATIAADTYEIDTMEKALTSIENDPYFLTVTGRYIDDLPDEQIAEKIPCEPTTVWRNRKRLVQKIAIRLYGAAAVT